MCQAVDGSRAYRRPLPDCAASFALQSDPPRLLPCGAHGRCPEHAWEEITPHPIEGCVVAVTWHLYLVCLGCHVQLPPHLYLVCLGCGSLQTSTCTSFASDASWSGLRLPPHLYLVCLGCGPLRMSGVARADLFMINSEWNDVGSNRAAWLGSKNVTQC